MHQNRPGIISAPCVGVFPFGCKPVTWRTHKGNLLFLSPDEVASLHIQQSVFHVLKREGVQLLGEFSNRRFDSFFKARVASSTKGNRYRFTATSPTRTALESIARQPNSFQEQSEVLAKEFQDLHLRSSSASPGTLLLLSLAGPGALRLFALLKFDSSEVITYGLPATVGGARVSPTLTNIKDTFVESRDALQKAALVRLDRDEVLVVDRRSTPVPARYFLKFLDVRRARDDRELTRDLVRLTHDFAEDNEDQLVPEVLSGLRMRLYQAAQDGFAVDGQNPDAWISTMVGQLPAALVRDFNRLLADNNLDGESFVLDPGAVRKPTIRNLVTVNGVTVRFPQEKEGNIVQLNRNAGGKITSILINDEVRRDESEEPDRFGT